MKAIILALAATLMLVTFTGCYDDGYYGRSYRRSGYYGHGQSYRDDGYSYRSRRSVYGRSARSYPYSSRSYRRPYYYGSRPYYYGPRRGTSVTIYR